MMKREILVACALIKVAESRATARASMFGTSGVDSVVVVAALLSELSLETAGSSWEMSAIVVETILPISARASLPECACVGAILNVVMVVMLLLGIAGMNQNISR